MDNQVQERDRGDDQPTKRPRTVRRKTCPHCHHLISTHNFTRHLPACAKKLGKPFVKVDLNDDDIYAMVGILFPTGIPSTPASLRAVTTWIEATRTIVQVLRGEVS